MASALSIPAEDHDWLAAEAGVTDAAPLAEELAALAHAVTSELGFTAPNLPLALWNCWKHHWRQAIKKRNRSVSAKEVLESIRAGRGYEGAGDLRGDVIRDVAVARGALAGVDEAIHKLRRDYYDRVRRQIGKQADLDPNWWDDVIALQTGFAPKTRGEGFRTAKLASYEGRCGLAWWLGVATMRHLTELAAPKKAPPPAPEPRDPFANTFSAECETLLIDKFRIALNAVPPAERLVLKLHYVDKLKGDAIAPLVGADPGTVSRRRTRGEAALMKALHDDSADVRDCLETVQQAGRSIDLGALLIEILRERSPA